MIPPVPAVFTSCWRIQPNGSIVTAMKHTLLSLAGPALLFAATPAGSRRNARADDAKPFHSAELVFPLHKQHNHAPGIVECPNGDLLVSWYRGSGERSADDVAVLRRPAQGRARQVERRVPHGRHARLPGLQHAMFDRQGRQRSGCSGRSSSRTRGSRA